MEAAEIHVRGWRLVARCGGVKAAPNYRAKPWALDYGLVFRTVRSRIPTFMVSSNDPDGYGLASGSFAHGPLLEANKVGSHHRMRTIAFCWFESGGSRLRFPRPTEKPANSFGLSAEENECEQSMTNAEMPVFQGLPAVPGGLSANACGRAIWLPGLDSNQRPFD